MASGVKVQDDCKTKFTEMKLGHKFKYIIYALTADLSEVQVSKLGNPDATYEDLVEEFKVAEEAGQCRYGVFDASYNSKEQGTKKNKIVFFMWSPDGAKIKQKMVYSSTKDALKRALGEGIQKEVQANDHGDLEWDSVLEVISRTDRD